MGLSMLDLETLGLVALAMLLGAIIGLEREFADKPAGLRTHMLVSGAAALFVPLGSTVLQHFVQSFNSELVQADPVRIIESVITGISVLGAGTILHHRSENEIEGLTTAASIMFTTGLGMAVALKRITLAIGATVLAIITLRLVGLVEDWLIRRHS
ncbi:MAG: MgtC/SapB family protein [Anaerolineae bacterium]